MHKRKTITKFEKQLNLYNMKFLAHDTVRVISNRHGHEFEIGETIKIIKTNRQANGGKGDYLARNEKGKTWFVVDEEVELVSY